MAPVQRFQPTVTTITTAGQVQRRSVGHNGQNALRRADAFEVMQLWSRARKKNAAPLFTAALICSNFADQKMIEDEAQQLYANKINIALQNRFLNAGCAIEAAQLPVKLSKHK